MNQQRFVGLLLVLAGGLLLVHQVGWLEISGKNFIGVLSILIGFSFLRKAFQRPDRRGVLGGTFFTVFGLFLLVGVVPNAPFPRALLLASIFIALAVANLVNFWATHWRRNMNLFMFFFFGAIGTSILLVYYDILDVWQFEEVVSTYWPVVLIVLGFMILIDSLVQKKERLEQEEPKDIVPHNDEEA